MPEQRPARHRDGTRELPSTNSKWAKLRRKIMVNRVHLCCARSCRNSVSPLSGKATTTERRAEGPGLSLCPEPDPKIGDSRDRRGSRLRTYPGCAWTTHHGGGWMRSLLWGTIAAAQGRAGILLPCRAGARYFCPVAPSPVQPLLVSFELVSCSNNPVPRPRRSRRPRRCVDAAPSDRARTNPGWFVTTADAYRIVASKPLKPPAGPCRAFYFCFGS